MPEAGSKIILQKSAVSEINFKKHLLKQPFFAKVYMNQQMFYFKKNVFKKD